MITGACGHRAQVLGTLRAQLSMMAPVASLLTALGSVVTPA